MNKKKIIIISSVIIIFCIIIGVFQHFYNLNKSEENTTEVSIIETESQENENSQTQISEINQNETEAINEEQKNNENKGTANNSSNKTANKNQKQNEGDFPQQNNNPVENAPNQNSGKTTTEKQEISVTLTISCKNALKYNVNIPASGYFLNGTRYNVKNGATVFDVLSNACKENGISLDYDGSYVSAIGGLREKQCTDDSGWMYRVNGKLPSKSMKNYKLKDGDKIEVYYVTSYKDLP